MKIITATLLLVISLLGILGTAFLYLGELTQGKGGGYLFILGCFLILGIQSFTWFEIIFGKRQNGEVKKYDYFLFNILKVIFSIGALQLFIQLCFFQD